AAFLEGYSALKNGKNDEAQTLFSRVVSKKKQIPEAHYNLALAYYHNEVFDSAIHHFEAYESLAKSGIPNDFQNTLGLAYYQKGDSEKAQMCFMKTPKLPAAQRNYQLTKTFSDLDAEDANLLQRDPRLCSIFLKWRNCGRCNENAKAFKRRLKAKKRDGTYRKSEFKELKHIIRKR
ncbi:MAG: tetratricopeptide repeat protein, partial [Bacteroidota bacterium]